MQRKQLIPVALAAVLMLQPVSAFASDLSDESSGSVLSSSMIGDNLSDASGSNTAGLNGFSNLGGLSISTSLLTQSTEAMQQQMQNTLNSLSISNDVSMDGVMDMYQNYLNASLSAGTGGSFGHSVLSSFGLEDMNSALGTFWNQEVGKNLDLNSLNLDYAYAAKNLTSQYQASDMSGKAGALFSQLDQTYASNKLNPSALLSQAQSQFHSSFSSALDDSSYKALKTSIGASGILSDASSLANSIQSTKSTISSKQATNDSKIELSKYVYSNILSSKNLLTEQVADLKSKKEEKVEQNLKDSIDAVFGGLGSKSKDSGKATTGVGGYYPDLDADGDGKADK